MPDIFVLRGDGNSRGQDVVESLLTTELACMARGRMELDENSGLRDGSMDCVYRDGLLLGELVQMYNPVLRTVQYGKLVSITHSAQGPELTTTLRVKVPSEFTV